MTAESTPNTTLEAVRAFAQPYDPEPSHSAQVTWIALSLFDQLRSDHQLSEDARVLLEAAGWLHDIGYARDPDTHHKRSRDMVVESHLKPFTQRERAMLACLVRYHRGSMPQPEHKVYGDLSQEDQALVCKLAALLRIADGLDRAHFSATSRVTATHTGEAITLLVEQRQPSPADIEGAQKKRDLMEAVFAVPVRIVAMDAGAPPLSIDPY